MSLKSILSASLQVIMPRRLWEAIWTGYSHWNREGEVARRHAANMAVVRRILQQSEPIRLELGAGTRRMPGWTSIDNNGLCDLTMTLVDALPFPDDSVEDIYASHVFEHFHHPELFRLLGECRRVLQSGGRLRLAVPDAALYIRDYNESNMDHLHRYVGEREGYLA